MIGPWLKQSMTRDIHVVLLAEATRHEMDCGCWCGPRVEPAGYTPAFVVTHRSTLEIAGAAS